MGLLLDSDTGQQAQSGGMVSPGLCLPGGPIGKAGPEAPAPDGGPPSHTRFALSGASGGHFGLAQHGGTTT